MTMKTVYSIQTIDLLDVSAVLRTVYIPRPVKEKPHKTLV